MDRIYSGDPIRLRQIVSNLLSNAVKFTHEGRIVLIVKLSIVNSQLTITVSDSGVGIPEEEQEKFSASLPVCREPKRKKVSVSGFPSPAS